MPHPAIRPAEARAKILLVDDQPANLLALRAVLDDQGHDLVDARSGEEALGLLLGDDFAVILLDVRMPGLDGFEVAQLIRRRDRFRHLPIIFLTAYDTDGPAVEQAYALGAVDFLVKPLAPVALRAKVAQFVELFQKTEQVRRMERREFERQLAEENARLRESEARKAAVLETALDCIITMDHEGKVHEFNPAAERTFGYRRADVLGREMAGLIVPPSLRDRHHRGLAHYLATGEGPVLNKRVEMPALRADGTEFPAEMTITRIPTQGPPVFTAFVRDITERKGADRRRDARLAVTQTLAQSLTLRDAAPEILRAVCESLNWDLGLLWVVDPQGRVLRCDATWHAPPVPVEGFEAVSRESTFNAGVGLPGRVWSSRQPAWVPNVAKDENFPRAAIAAQAGLHGAFAFPVLAGPEVLGVLEFLSSEVREPDPDLLEMAATLGGQVGQFTGRRRGEKELHRQEEERRIARRIQQGLLPKVEATLPGFRVSGRCVAATDVGGDCFDFLPLTVGDQESLGVLVADASGHGVGAALLAAETRAYLRALALTRVDVGTLLTLANRRLAEEIASDHFVTLFLMRLDLHSRRLLYASAGHWPGYVLDGHGRTRAVLASTGMPLGVDPAAEFPESPAVPLERGGLVFLFTDGFVDAASPDGERFGLERALSIVRAQRRETPDEILGALFDAVGDFSGHPLQDDLTAVILKAEGVA